MKLKKIKLNKYNDPVDIGQENDDGDLLEKNQKENGFLLEED